jgi:hypothetical protein
VSTTQILFDMINGYKTYAATILAVACGVGRILARPYNYDLADFLQALSLIFGGIAVMGMRHSISKVPSAVFTEAGRTE